MDPSRPDASEQRAAETRRLAALGVAYLLASAGLFYALLVDRPSATVLALAGVGALVVVSLVVQVRREGLVTAENGIIGGCVVVAMGLLFVLSGYTALPSAVVYGAVFVVGVIVPGLLLEFGLDRREE